MAQGLTLQQLQAIGAQPVQPTTPQPATGGGITLDQLQAMGATPVPSTVPTPQGVSGLQGIAVGVVKGAGSTGTGLYETGAKIGRGIEKVADALSRLIGGKKANIAPSQLTSEESINNFKQKYLAPQGGAEKLGFGAEQVGEFFIPAGKVSEVEKILATGSKTRILSKLAPLIGDKSAGLISKATELGTKMVVRGAEGGAIIGAQSGFNEKQTKDAAIISALFPAAGEGVEQINKFIKSQGKEFAPKIINSLIKPSKADFAYGKNPGKAVADAGITASSLDELSSKISEVKNKVGESIRKVVDAATEKGTTINTSDFLTPLDSKIQELSKTPLTNATAINRLDSLRNDLKSLIKGDTMTPVQAFDLKQVVGGIARFTGNPSDDKAINSATQDIYRNIKNGINKSAKGLKVNGKTIEELNEEYGGLLSAEKASTNRADIIERQNLISLPESVTAVGTGLISAATGIGAIPSILTGAGTTVLSKALESPRVKTSIASWLAKAPAEEKTRLFNAVPALRGIIIKTFIGDSN